MAVVKFRITGDGKRTPFYPECPYAIDYVFTARCRHPDSEYDYCDTNHMIKSTCPLDVKK